MKSSARRVQLAHHLGVVPGRGKRDPSGKKEEGGNGATNARNGSCASEKAGRRHRGAKRGELSKGKRKEGAKKTKVQAKAEQIHLSSQGDNG